MEMRHVLIVTGGSVEDAFVLAYLEKEKPDMCIAVDFGMDFFYRNKKNPDVIVGDFDSVSKEALFYFQKQKDIEWKQLNPRKDDTDTEYAVRYAIAQKAEKITLLGATGTRMDHVLGNIAVLGIGLEENVPIELLDSNNKIRMIDHGITIKKEQQYKKYVSLIPYTPQVTKVTLTGFLYPLQEYTLKNFCTLGISNEILEEEGVITFEEGILLVIESGD